MRHSAAVFLFCTCTAIAQSTLSGPSLGLVYDGAAQAIRPILGIPGASTTGKHIDAGFPITAAAISPTQDFVLAVSARGSLNLVLFAAAGVTSQAIASTATPDRIVLSPSASSAILYYKNASAVQIVSGLPSSLRVGQQVDISSLPQAPDTFAISDDGAVVLAGVIENASGSPAQGEVFAIPQSGTAPRSIGRVQHASAIAFFKQSHDVVIADDAANSIRMFSDAAGATALQWVFSNPGLPAPDSVEVSPDGKIILAGSSQNGLMAVMDSKGANAVFVSCVCIPTEFRPLSVAGVYQISEPKSGLLWILDSSTSSPRVLFVPVPSDSESTVYRSRHR
jgi:DNA-binding beta-propeller fold protein YncE